MRDFGTHLEQKEVKQEMRRARMEDRTQAGGPGQLKILGKPHDWEVAWIENISDHGVRVISRSRWRSGERMLITSRFPPFYSTAASVVYCQTLLAGLYAIGCEYVDASVLQLPERNADSEPTDTRPLESSAAFQGLAGLALTKS
jgi:hypothetical protein